MEVIIGGRAQGKTRYACMEHPGYTVLDGMRIILPSAESEAGGDGDGIILNHTHLLIRRMLDAGASGEEILTALRRFADLNPGLVLISDEIGSGIVPMNYDERRWREVTGRVLTAMAARADKVLRIQCGIAQVLREGAEKSDTGHMDPSWSDGRQ